MAQRHKYKNNSIYLAIFKYALKNSLHLIALCSVYSMDTFHMRDQAKPVYKFFRTNRTNLCALFIALVS